MNWFSAIENGLLIGLIMSFSVIGLAVAFRLFNFPDLSVEGSFMMGSIGVAVVHKAELGLPWLLLIPLTFGALTGVLTAALHVRFRINKFLAAILVVSMLYTVGLRLLEGPNAGLLSLSSTVDQFVSIASLDSSHSKILLLFFLMSLVVYLLWRALISFKGLRVRVAGSNPKYAASLKISVLWSTILALAITNSFSALSGALLTLQQGFSDVGIGHGVLIVGLASMTVGERLLPERRIALVGFVLLSAVIGSVVYQVLFSLAIQAGFNPVDLKFITAALVLALIVVRLKDTDDSFDRIS